MKPLWKSWKTVMEMLMDRGYDVPDDHILEYDDFISYYGDNDITNLPYKEILCTIKHKTRNEFISVFWRETIGTGDIQEIVENLNANDVHHCIIVYSIKITPYASMALKPLKIQKINIEIFSLKELQYNIIKHKDVPRHIICSASKKQEILEKYNITQNQLPVIKITDPVCRYYNATKGQLIKIIRKSESISSVTLSDGTIKDLYDISYRIVI